MLQWTSVVAQWLRIRLPMQGTRVQSLVREDPTCRGATKSMCHNYWACALEPASHNYWSPRAYSPCSATREATSMRSPRTTMKSSLRLPQLEKAHAQQRRTIAAKKKTHVARSGNNKLCNWLLFNSNESSFPQSMGRRVNKTWVNAAMKKNDCWSIVCKYKSSETT